jgi:hypothetical protein
MTDYDTDILAWSKVHDALRRRAANEIDWENIAEEIEDLGNEQRFTVESLLTKIMQHKLQIMARPNTLAAAPWQHEIDDWRVQVERRLRRAPALRPIIEAELADLYQDAVKTMCREIDGVPRGEMPVACPFTLATLLTDDVS